MLLLPEQAVRRRATDELRAILAHELSHARNHDLAWNFAAHVASILLWFHPLAWRIRAAHAAACDSVCDAVAADLLGDVASYGRTLARLAVRAAWPPPVARPGYGPNFGRPPPPRCPEPDGLSEPALVATRHARALHCERTSDSHRRLQFHARRTSCGDIQRQHRRRASG